MQNNSNQRDHLLHQQQQAQQQLGSVPFQGPSPDQSSPYGMRSPSMNSQGLPSGTQQPLTIPMQSLPGQSPGASQQQGNGNANNMSPWMRPATQLANTNSGAPPPVIGNLTPQQLAQLTPQQQQQYYVLLQRQMVMMQQQQQQQQNLQPDHSKPSPQMNMYQQQRMMSQQQHAQTQQFQAQKQHQAQLHQQQQQSQQAQQQQAQQALLYRQQQQWLLQQRQKGAMTGRPLNPVQHQQLMIQQQQHQMRLMAAAQQQQHQSQQPQGSPGMAPSPMYFSERPVGPGPIMQQQQQRQQQHALQNGHQGNGTPPPGFQGSPTLPRQSLPVSSSMVQAQQQPQLHQQHLAQERMRQQQLSAQMQVNNQPQQLQQQMGVGGPTYQQIQQMQKYQQQHMQQKLQLQQLQQTLGQSQPPPPSRTSQMSQGAATLAARAAAASVMASAATASVNSGISAPTSSSMPETTTDAKIPFQNPAMANVTRLSNQDWSHAYLEFMKSIGKELNRVPMIGDKAVDLRALLSQTVELGGFQKVTSDDKWPWLVKLLGYDQVGSTPEGLKRFYYALLLDFEKRVYPHLSSSNPVVDHVPSPSGPTKLSHQSVPLQRTSSKGQVSSSISDVPPSIQSPLLPSPGMPHVQLPAGIPLQSAATLVTGPITQGSTQYQQPPPQIYQVPPGLTPPTVSHVPLPLKHVEPPTYTPKVRKIVSFGGIETPIFELALKSFEKPDALNVGTLDLYRITMSLRSLLEPEVKYALDALLVISCQKQPLISLMKWTDLLTSLLSCMECCIEGAFGVLDKSPKKIRHVKESLYTTMYENEEREIEDLHDLGLKTLEDERVGHAERVLAMSTIFSNFAFQPDNALFLAKNERFRDIILSLLIVTRQTCIPGMTSRQAGLLEHRKNLITLLSNIGSHYSIQPAYGQLYVDIVADFISHEGSVYAYIALEAFAKLTLLEQNHDAVLECDGLDAIIRCIKGCFPSSGLSLETTPETAASWELASLLFFNLTDMRDDSVIASLIKEPGLVQLLIRVIESGIRVGHDHHADFIRIITCRLLKSLSSLFRSHESNGNFSKYETQLVNLLMSVGQSNITQGFQKDASQSLMECLETLSPQD